MTVDELLKHYGVESQVDLAARLGVSPGAISQWRAAGQIPAYRQLAIETMTQGALRADRKALFQKLAG